MSLQTVSQLNKAKSDQWLAVLSISSINSCRSSCSSNSSTIIAIVLPTASHLWKAVRLSLPGPRFRTLRQVKIWPCFKNHANVYIYSVPMNSRIIIAMEHCMPVHRSSAEWSQSSRSEVAASESATQSDQSGRCSCSLDTSVSLWTPTSPSTPARTLHFKRGNWSQTSRLRPRCCPLASQSEHMLYSY